MVLPKLRRAGGDVPVTIRLRRARGDVPVTVGVAGRKPYTPTPPAPDPDPVPPRPPAPTPVGSPVDRLLADKPFYVAHRLGGDEYPEFTLEGMQAAISHGYKAFEFSTYMTSDGVFIGSHDWTTERTTGVRHEIWNTSWETVQTLDQQGGKIIRLEQLVERLPEDGVIFLDHKATSHTAEPTQWNVQFETQLFDLLETLFDNPQERVVWKVFAESTSAERARARGYKVNCMLYPSTLPADGDFSRWDILGMEWHADKTAWDAVNAPGLPTIGHIVRAPDHAAKALGFGATGLMVSTPSTVHP